MAFDNPSSTCQHKLSGISLPLTLVLSPTTILTTKAHLQWFLNVCTPKETIQCTTIAVFPHHIVFRRLANIRVKHNVNETDQVWMVQKPEEGIFRIFYDTLSVDKLCGEEDLQQS